jgi:hypothetical protein
MPGTSRMPVSLRNTFAAKKGSSSGQLLSLNIDLYVSSLARAHAVETDVTIDCVMLSSSSFFSGGLEKLF